MLIIDWLLIIALGALCGFLGQSLRVVVGLHKAAQAEKQTEFEYARLLISLLIGVLAGALAAIAATTAIGVTPGLLDTQTVLALVAAGYAGADFIEGFVGKYLPK